MGDGEVDIIIPQAAAGDPHGLQLCASLLDGIAECIARALNLLPRLVQELNQLLEADF